MIVINDTVAINDSYYHDPDRQTRRRKEARECYYVYVDANNNTSTMFDMSQ